MNLADSSGSPTRVHPFQIISKSLGLLAFAAVGLLSTSQAAALPLSFSGLLGGDDQVQEYIFSTPSFSQINFSTNSYGGGTFNGVKTAAGGFVPVISVFNSTSGALIASDGADGTCSAGMMADPTTKMCDDASLNLFLGAGSYLVALSEFFNEPVGPNLSNGFLEQGLGNYTASTCGATTGAFYEVDVAPCVQRTANFTLNIGTAVPEPSSLWLALPVIAFGVMRRRAAKA